MKKSSSPVRMNDNEDRLHKSALPKIRYGKAMASYFVTQDGAIRSVEGASVEEIAQLVEASVSSARELHTCELALRGLDYRQQLDRWFAVCELLNAGCDVRIFVTVEQAHQSQKGI